MEMNITEHSLPSANASITTVTPIVFVVDDDASVRESLASLIRSGGWHPKLLSSAQEFLALPRTHAPCCLLLDVDLPDLSGLDLQQRVSDRTDMPIIFIADRGDISTTVKAMKAGAVEFLIKPFRNDVMRNAMRDAIERSRAAVMHEAGMSVLREHLAALTRREREVMELVLSGWMNKQIAAKLGITEITVKVHRGNMMRKMGADSFLDLVKIATRLRLMPVTKGESAAARPLNTRIAVRSGSRRPSAHAVAPEGLCLPSATTGRLTTHEDGLHASFSLACRLVTVTGKESAGFAPSPCWFSAERENPHRSLVKETLRHVRRHNDVARRPWRKTG
jgi:FixJ family two-component response regulator